MRAPTTCDPHLNSFHHDISLDLGNKRRHCGPEESGGLNKEHCAAQTGVKKKKKKDSLYASIQIKVANEANSQFE